MKSYILKRLFSLIWMLLGITFLVFLLLQLAPGDFLTPIKAQRDIQPEMIERLEKEFGLNLPFWKQYLLWLKNVVQLNFGYSWTYKTPVIDLVLQRAGATLILSICSLAVAWVAAVILGLLSAMYHGSWLDRITSFFAYASFSMPEFFLAILAVWLAAKTGWFPVGGRTSIDYDFLSPVAKILDLGHHLILPVAVMSLGSVAGMMRIMRASVLDVIRADYITTARAKGVSEPRILFCHLLRSAINPLLSVVGFAISGLLSGSLIVENVLNYPGLGRLIYEAFIKEDQFVVLGSVVLGSTLLVVGNLISDLLLAWADPRIRYEK